MDPKSYRGLYLLLAAVCVLVVNQTGDPLWMLCAAVLLLAFELTRIGPIKLVNNGGTIGIAPGLAPDQPAVAPDTTEPSR